MGTRFNRQAWPFMPIPSYGGLWTRRHNCRAQGVRPVGAPDKGAYC
jgi:hypothetical protein